jgi:hypothetical protein
MNSGGLVRNLCSTVNIGGWLSIREHICRSQSLKKNFASYSASRNLFRCRERRSFSKRSQNGKCGASFDPLLQRHKADRAGASGSCRMAIAARDSNGDSLAIAHAHLPISAPVLRMAVALAPYDSASRIQVESERPVAAYIFDQARGITFPNLFWGAIASLSATRERPGLYGLDQPRITSHTSPRVFLSLFERKAARRDCRALMRTFRSQQVSYQSHNSSLGKCISAVAGPEHTKQA